MSRTRRLKFEGSLVRKPGSTAEQQRVYFIENGRRRWVTTADWIISRGMKWPSDVRLVDARELDAIPLGPNLP